MAVAHVLQQGAGTPADAHEDEDKPTADPPTARAAHAATHYPWVPAARTARWLAHLYDIAYLGESAAAGGCDQRRVADEQHAEHCATRGIVSHIGVERGWRGSAPTAGGTVFKQS